MTHKLLLLAATVMVSCMLWGQQSAPVTYTVKGILVDSLTQESEPYATIRITRKENPAQAVKMAVTDNKGKFQEKITGSGEYRMTITSIGKSTVDKEFALRPEERTVDFGTLYTSEMTNELGAVEIVAQKPLVKVDIDKIEYNIEDDPDSKTNSMLEMLRKVPLVTVDGEDKIQVNGSSSFKVHINGKPNNMMSDNPSEVLKSMPANTIKHIEVITSPGAKYDAEGVGGILNIVTVGGGFEGYTATFSGNVSNMGFGGSTYATIKQNKLTLTGNYGINRFDQPRGYTYGEGYKEEEKTVEISDGWNKYKGTFQHGNLEASYDIDTLRLVSVSFGLHGSNNDAKGLSDVRLLNSNELNSEPIYHYNRLNNSENSWFSIRGGLDYQRLFSVKDRMFTLSYRINHQPRTTDEYLNYEKLIMSDQWEEKLMLYNRHADGEQSTSEHTFQADYVTPIHKYHTIEAGMKYIIRNNKSDNDLFYMNRNDEYELSSDRSSHYKHLSDILAAYAGYSVRYKSLMGKAGVRYEYTMQDVKYKYTPDRNFDTNFNDVVPSASIGWKIGQTRNLRLNYDMRIWRPSIYYLNPYLNDNDPMRIRQGNPNLESEKNHRFQLSYSSFTQKFNINTSLSHSFTNNSINEFTELKDPNEIAGLSHTDLEERVFYTTYDNVGKNKNTNLSLYINWNASPKTRIYINANGGYTDLKGGTNPKNPSQRLSNNGWNLFSYGGVQHTFPQDIRVSINLMAATPRTTLQGRYNGFYDYGLNVNKSFLNKRLTLSAFANNVFTKYMTHGSTIHGAGFTDMSETKYSRRRYGMSISYRIGDLRAQVKKASRTISNDDVKEGGGDNSGGGNN